MNFTDSQIDYFLKKIEYKFYQYYKSLSPEILKSMLKDYGKLKFVKEQYAVSLFVLISTKKVENTVQAENLLKIIEYKFKQRCKSEEYFLNMEIFIKNKMAISQFQSINTTGFVNIAIYLSI